MSSTRDLLLVAIQMGWKDKYDEGTPPKFESNNGKSYQYSRARGWINVEWTLEELAKSISEGYSFCPQLTSGNGKKADYDDFRDFEDFYWNGTYRNDQSFFQTNVVAVDIDVGYDSIEAISKIDFFQQYGMLLYTTASHDPGNGKIKARIVFQTENIITRKENMKFLYTALNDKFGGDPQCSDSCRLFYGSENCYIEKYPERFIPKAVVRQLVKAGKSLRKKAIGYSKNNSNDVPTDRYINNHCKQLPQDQEFRLKDDALIQLKDLPKKLREFEQDLNRAGTIQCYCPLPDHGVDRNPGAFLAITSRMRLPYFYCGKCCKDHTSYFIETKNSDLESRQDIEIWKENNRYLEIIPDLFSGCVLVKSPKGSGKTSNLIKLVKRWKKDGKTILLLGHRVSLLSSMAYKLDLDFYKESKHTKSRDEVVHSKHFALCVNSLWRLSPVVSLKIKHYDVVILDESEQVIQHLASSTIPKNRRYEVIKNFYRFIRKANQIYCLDADLGNLTINVICDYIRGETHDVTAILNEWKPDEKEVNLYESKAMFIDELLANVGKDGQKIAILSNSKAFVTTIENSIFEKHPNLSVVCIHGENSNSSEMQYFIALINENCKKLDVLIASPSIGTGVDITTPFDKVYGCFEHLCGNTHQDIDQHLHRIRNYNAMHVWISKNFDTARVHANEIEWALEQTNRKTNQLISFVDDGPDRITRLFLSICAMVKAKVNRSRNQLRNNWVGLQHENGIRVKLIVNDKGKELENLSYYGQSKLELEERWLIDLDRTLKEHNDPEHIERLQYKKNLSYAEKLLVEAEKIRDFYRLPEYNLDFLQRHKAGLMNDVNRFEILTRDIGDIGNFDLNERTWGYMVGDRKQKSIKVLVQKYILKTAGLKDCYDTTTQVTKDELGSLVKLIDKKKADIEDILDITIRKDYEKQIVRVFSKMLETMGLYTVSKQRRNEGKLQRFYSLDAEHLKIIQFILERRGKWQLKFMEAKNPVAEEVVEETDKKTIIRELMSAFGNN